jgi:hypothetical protein
VTKYYAHKIKSCLVAYVCRIRAAGNTALRV